MRGILVSCPDHTNPIVARVHSCSKWKWFGSPSALLRLGQDHRQQKQQWLVGLQYYSEPHHHPRNSPTHRALTEPSWMVPRFQTIRRLLQREERREKNNTHDKIQQRLTTNGCMLAATINMTWEDKMKNSKRRNQRTCQRLSESMPRTPWDHSLTMQELDFLEKIIGDERCS